MVASDNPRSPTKTTMPVNAVTFPSKPKSAGSMIRAKNIVAMTETTVVAIFAPTVAKPPETVFWPSDFSDVTDR